MLNSPIVIKPVEKITIKAVGCITSVSFHATKYILNNLKKHHPDLIDKCVIRGVMDVAWTRCLWQLNQILGGIRRRNTVAIFVDKKYIGTHEDFQEYLITKHKFAIQLLPLDYKRLICSDVDEYYNDDKLTFVSMDFDVSNWIIGHVTIALFDRLVPKTCEYFKRMCMDKTDGYLNSTIHRVDITNGFIQAGRIFGVPSFLEKENYSVSHDRRGVLSMANRHKYFNGPEFVISLQPNLWMDNKYVAFGRVVEGEKTLRFIEKHSVAHEILGQQIRIRSCDVLPKRDTNPVPDKRNALKPFFRHIVRRCMMTATYIRVYGKPDPIQQPDMTDREYVESIVSTVVNKFMGKIGYCSRPTASAAPVPLRSNDDSMTKTHGNVRSATTDDRGYVFKPYGRCDVFINDQNRRPTAPAKTATHATKNRNGIRLPAANHKLYWKYRKIYESITK